MSKRKVKAVWGDLSSYPEGVQEVMRFMVVFAAERDRSAVLLVASKMDVLLERILDRHLLPVTTGKDELLESDGPLGSFSARINICYRLGLIGRPTAKCLHLVRKIRNSFAHSFDDQDLQTHHKDRVRELINPFKQEAEVRESFISIIQQIDRRASDAKSDFVMASAALTSLLDGISRSVKVVTNEPWEPLERKPSTTVKTEKKGK